MTNVTCSNCSRGTVDQARALSLCDAGQNWFVFDEKKKNKLGEPGIVLFDHGMAVEDGEASPGKTSKPSAWAACCCDYRG